MVACWRGGAGGGIGEFSRGGMVVSNCHTMKARQCSDAEGRAVALGSGGGIAMTHGEGCSGVVDKGEGGLVFIEVEE
ncbi:hypothetical protein GUJ93_ZPchr0004g39849 [Zizania palustris]|uniref:Uncharacterized protein n=1 Tax=Zizania palustris TaxID=103762 RepID=A0A8J5SZW8_ZIZPA|nr:hypothetical protein GUJ93_ZPchr0004g39849 [Zizania palustris]